MRGFVAPRLQQHQALGKLRAQVTRGVPAGKTKAADPARLVVVSFRRRGRRQVDTPRSVRLLLLTRGIQSGELHSLLNEHAWPAIRCSSVVQTDPGSTRLIVKKGPLQLH